MSTAVSFNPQNSTQTAHHLRRLIKTNSKLSEINSIINSVFREAIGPFDDIIKISSCGTITVPYYDEHGEGDTSNWLSIRNVGAEIAFAMHDYDAPFSTSDVLAFCSFFEIDPKPMLKEAISDEKYQEWANDERRAYQD
jgi:hypothetical protein